MPALKNQRQERFCQLVRQGVSPYRAYPEAGYSANTGSPYRLHENARIKRRIAELTRHFAMKTKITVESIAAQFNEDRAFAIELQQPATAHAASVSLAKLFGLMIEKRETGGPGEFGSMQTAAEVLDALKSQFGPEVADLLKVAVERSEAQQTATAPVQQIDNSFGEAEKSIAAFRKRPQERR